MSFSCAIFLTLAYALCAYGVQHFQIHDCTPADSPMHVGHIHLSPDPLTIPGNIHLSFEGHTTRNISHSSLKLVLKKKHALLGIFDLTVPCISHVGSCEYNDICTILTEMKQPSWGFGLMASVSDEIQAMFKAVNIDPTRCPFPPSHIHVSDAVISLPHAPSALSWFAAVSSQLAQEH